MAYAFDSTVGGAAANSYETVANADDYFIAIPSYAATWAALATLDKQYALSRATWALDRMNFRGNRINDVQGLEFPRDVVDITNTYDSGVIPDKVLQAQLEMVMYQAESLSATTGTASKEIDKVEVVGTVKVEFKSSLKSGSDMAAHGTLDAVRALLREWLLGEGVMEVSRA